MRMNPLYAQGARIGYLAGLLNEKHTENVYPESGDPVWRKGFEYGYAIAKAGQKLPKHLRGIF
jgi:hypothetical protein